MTVFVKVYVPFKGTGYSVKISCEEYLIKNTLRDDIPDFLKNFWQNKFTKSIFLDYNNFKKLPPSVFSLLRNLGREKVRKLIPELSNMIDWGKVRIIYENNEGINEIWCVCPKCNYYDPTGYGQGAVCPNCS